MEANVREFTQSVQKPKGTTADPETWKELIGQQTEVAQSRANDAIDSAKECALQIIQELPGAEREGAADVYIVAS